MFLFLFLKWCILESDCLTIAHLWSQYWFFQKWTCQVLQALSGASWNGSLQHLEFLLKTANPKKKQGPRSFPCLGLGSSRMLYLRVSRSNSALNSRLCFWVILLPASPLQCWAVKRSPLHEGSFSLWGSVEVLHAGLWASPLCPGWGAVLGIVQVCFVWHVCVHPTQNIQEWAPFLSKLAGRQQVSPFLLQERWYLSFYPISPIFSSAPVYFCVCYLAWPGKEWP